MNADQDLIWNYLDGICSQEEQLSIEARLASDEDFRAIFLQSKALHEQLQQSSLEMPSMRFTRNVMDQLPAVRNLPSTPLVSAKWMRVFAGSTLGLIAFILVSSILFPPSLASETSQDISLLAPVFSLLDRIPANTVMMTGILFSSLVLLILLDKWLQSKFQKG